MGNLNNTKAQVGLGHPDAYSEGVKQKLHMMLKI